MQMLFFSRDVFFEKMDNERTIGKQIVLLLIHRLNSMVAILK